MSYNKTNPVLVTGGENVVELYGGLLTHFGNKCLIITGKNSAVKSGALEDVTKKLSEVGIAYTVFDGITENPRTSDCFEAGRLAREEKAQFLIGIGGGSVLDAAKAAAVYATNEHLNIPDLIYYLPVEKKRLPLILIGTTAGTGSEVTGVSVLTNEKGRKKSVKGSNYYAALVLADPKYTYSAPYSVTVSTALDAFCHATESFFSARANDESENNSQMAFSLICNELFRLEKSKELPDNEARDRLYDGSLYAGAAINLTGCCFPHTLSYFLTEKYGIPHGKACAVFLPEFVRRATACLPEKAELYFKKIGVDSDSFERTVLSLADVKIDLDSNELEKYLANWSKVANFDNSPGGFTWKDAKSLIEKLFG